MNETGWYPVRLVQGNAAVRLTDEPVSKKEALAVLYSAAREWRCYGGTTTIDYRQEDGTLDRTCPWWTLKEADYQSTGENRERAILYLEPAGEKGGQDGRLARDEPG